jgi:hypothetical protein
MDEQGYFNLRMTLAFRERILVHSALREEMDGSIEDHDFIRIFIYKYS